MRRHIFILSAIALLLGACATTPGVDPKVAAQQRVDQIGLAYVAVRSVAVGCAYGSLCKDEGVRAAVAAAIPTVDLAVAEGTRLILANATDESAVTKGIRIAMAAIDVLAKALQSYGVKV